MFVLFRFRAWVVFIVLLVLLLLWTVPADGAVLIQDGSDALRGRVEIYHQDTFHWGSVCGDDWDIHDANVVCRQLDLGEAIEATTGLEFGRGERPIIMNRVACRGTEGRLADCPFVCTSYQQCNSSNVAGVVCRPKTSMAFSFDSPPPSYFPHGSHIWLLLFYGRVSAVGLCLLTSPCRPL